MSKPVVRLLALSLFLFAGNRVGAKTIRIVSYNVDCADQSSDNNITSASHSVPTVLQAIGLHHIGTNAQPLDVLGLEELNSTTLVNLTAQLNTIYGAGVYAYDPTTDPNTGGGPDGLIYNTQTIQVISARALPTGQNVLLQANATYTAAYNVGGGVNGPARGPMLYRLRPVGSGTNADFYMYVSHARSTSDNSVGDARYAEAQEVRSDAKYNLPAGAHILYSGDWNLFNGSGENAYECLTGQTTSDNINWADASAVWANTNQTQAYDPTSKTSPPTTTTWANAAGDNANYLYGDSSGTLTSRIDIQLVNAPMLAAYNNQGGMQLAPDSSDPFDSSNFPSSQYPYAFEVFGNNGTTPRSSSVTASGNHSLDDLASTTPNAATAYSDILLTGSGSTFTGSDHYPLVGDYNVVSLAAAALSLSNIQTVFIIPMENQNWSSISGNVASAPYINNTVLPMAARAEQYYNPPGLHPSLPNYFWMEAGTNFGFTSDPLPSSAHQNTTNHLATYLKNAGVPWRSYDEDICGCNCPLANTNLYLPRHNPVVYFDDVTDTNIGSSATCISRVRPYSQFSGDLQSNLVARFNWVVPNACDDMHNNSGCATGNPILNGDNWLAANLPAILGSAAYTNNGAVFIVWDEGASGDGPIGCIVLSPLARTNYSNTLHYTHSSLLRTFQEIFNVMPFLGDAANATDLGDLFTFGSAQLGVSPASGLTAAGQPGGPFSPSSQSYTLTNSGSGTLNWTASNTANWLTLSATAGSLASGSSATVTASINANANSLAVGAYSDTITFTNTSNANGSTTRAVSLSVTNNLPFITSLTPSGTVPKNAGDTASFSVSATGPSLAYQWKFGLNNLTNDSSHVFGAQSSSLTLSNVLGGDSGAYSVVVTNAYGSAATNLVLTVTTNDVKSGIRLSTLPSFVYTQAFNSLPGSGTMNWSNNITLKGWYADKSGGANGALTNVDSGTSTLAGLHDYGASGNANRALAAMADSGGSYYANVAFGARFTNDTPVVVSNLTIAFTGEQWRQTANNNTLQFYYRITNGPATNVDAGNTLVWTAVSALNFAAPHTGTAGALDGTAAANQAYKSNLVSSVNLQPGQELCLRWYIPSQYPCPGLAVDNLSVTFASMPFILTQPQNVNTSIGSNATFSVAAGGPLPFSYQWQGKGSADPVFTAIPGENNPSYTRNGVAWADNGSQYRVVVSNAIGAVTSSSASLAVAAPLPPVLGSPQFSSGQFQFSLTGSVGLNYAVQSSSNLVDWLWLMTNASPFTFADTNAPPSPELFYRGVWVP